MATIRAIGSAGRLLNKTRREGELRKKEQELAQRVKQLKNRGRAIPWRTIFTRKSKALRWRIIRAPWIFPIAAYNLAAIEIQRIFRGKICRRRLREKAQGIKYINRSQGPSRPYTRGKKVDGAQLSKYLANVRTQQNRGTGDNQGFQGWCCIRIQAWWRMILVQKYFKYQAFYIFGIAALQIQVAWRKYCQQRYFDSAASSHEPIIITDSDVAARIVQNAWRSYTSCKIFKYYRDLINFRLAGDPAVLLRTINPQEAAIFDAAMGIHIRFRLGRGLTTDFPPVIYYKVFTHNPLCDVNSFAPRDYTRHRPVSPTDLHNNEDKDAQEKKEGSIRVGRSFFDTVVSEGKDDQSPFQYRRFENNPWRPITVKTLQDMDKTPEMIREEAKSQPFHFSRIKRQQDIAQRRREQKRKWLMKMYKEGLAQESAEAKGTDLHSYLVEQKGDIAGDAEIEVDFDGDDWEVEANALLQWSEELDYDGYVQNWMEIGTSGSSHTKVTRNYQESKLVETSLVELEEDIEEEDNPFAQYSKAFSHKSSPITPQP